METRGGPGRSCPLSYHYGAAALAGRPNLSVETLWVAGGLYGNVHALERLLALQRRDQGRTALVFNGDFHWFDIDPAGFRRINEAVLAYPATRGNVETELATPGDQAGCGCGYPDWVDDGTVARSNEIMARLKRTGEQFADALARLAALPAHLTALVGGERVAVVHGDADSLAGWGFSQEALGTAQGRLAAERAFHEAGVRVFASSHSCLPVIQEFEGERAIVNNGAAGMPNFSGTQFGIATRISVSPWPEALYGMRCGRLYVQAVALDYDAPAWERDFLAQWPRGSAAFASYYERIAGGPGYALSQALRPAAAAIAE